MNFTKESHGYLSATKSIKEVDLFRFFIKAFTSMSSYNVGEIHGNRRQVVFDESKGWYTRNSQCELGDVAIIAFSKAKGQGRLVIMQNKVSRNTYGEIFYNPRGVHANLVQHELLTVRPRFQYIKSPGAGKPNNLIQASPYPSVCLYGNFYLNRSDIDMSALTASKLVAFPLSFKWGIPRTGKHPTASIEYKEPFETMKSRSTDGDFIGAGNLFDFGNLLEDLYIGRPINYIEKRKIESELRFALQSYSTDLLEPVITVINDFLETEFNKETDFYADDNYSEDSSSGILDICRSLLIINVDSKECVDKFELR